MGIAYFLFGLWRQRPPRGGHTQFLFRFGGDNPTLARLSELGSRLLGRMLAPIMIQRTHLSSRYLRLDLDGVTPAILRCAHFGSRLLAGGRSSSRSRADFRPDICWQV